MNEDMGGRVRTHDPDRYLTALLAPPSVRDGLLTLYAFAHELARACAMTSEPDLALIRLHWWREVVEGAPRRHDIATPLTALIRDGRLSAADLSPVIDAWEMEAHAPGMGAAFGSMDAWRAWLMAGEGGIAVAAARLLGSPDPEKARVSGAVSGAARVLRGNRAAAARGQCWLPEDVTRDNGVTIEDAIAAPDGLAVAGALRRLAEEGLSWVPGSVRRVPRAWRAAVLPAVLARRDLRRIARGAAPVSARERGFGDRFAVVWSGL